VPTFSHTYTPGVFVKGGIVTEGVIRGGRWEVSKVSQFLLVPQRKDCCLLEDECPREVCS
jgi:hypothetical protein